MGWGDSSFSPKLEPQPFALYGSLQAKPSLPARFHDQKQYSNHRGGLIKWYISNKLSSLTLSFWSFTDVNAWYLNFLQADVNSSGCSIRNTLKVVNVTVLS